MSDFISILIVALVIMALMLGALMGLNAISTYQSCARLQALSPDAVYHWDFWNGCLVQGPTGVFVPWDEYPYLQVDTQ